LIHGIIGFRGLKSLNPIIPFSFYDPQRINIYIDRDSKSSNPGNPVNPDPI
jgi:hypothetical protein